MPVRKPLTPIFRDRFAQHFNTIITSIPLSIVAILIYLTINIDIAFKKHFYAMNIQ